MEERSRAAPPSRRARNRSHHRLVRTTMRPPAPTGSHHTSACALCTSIVSSLTDKTGYAMRRGIAVSRRIARPRRPGDDGGMPAARLSRRWVTLVLAAAALAVAAITLAMVTSTGSGPVAAGPTSTASETPTPTPTPTPSPTPTMVGAPPDDTAYDLGGLPTADVFAVIPALPVDEDPAGELPGLLATPAIGEIPVFAAPGEPPVARLLPEQTFGGTTVPVVEQHDHWVRVLLTGRQGVPPEGDPAQLSGWLRIADVTLDENDARVEVSLSARSVSIVTDAGTETVASDLGWGTDATPTPLGRTFIMHMQVVPEFGYTRGHPLVYLGVQSPTLAGFGGASVAVTAFHYHDARSGAISNGCLRLDGPGTDRLAALPLGTPVVITG